MLYCIIVRISSLKYIVFSCYCLVILGIKILIFKITKQFSNMKKDAIWALITKIIVFVYVTIGGGYEIYVGITTKHVHTSFIFAFLSGSIFVGRIGYGLSSGARKTIPADIYGLIVMWFLAGLRLHLNGF